MHPRLSGVLVLAIVASAMATPAQASVQPSWGVLGFSSAHRGAPLGGLGQPAAPASQQAVAATVQQMTGLEPSAVTTADACGIAPPGFARCEAQVMILRTGRTVVRPHVGARKRLQHRASKRLARGSRRTGRHASIRGPAAGRNAGLLAAGLRHDLPGSERRRGGHDRDRHRLRRSNRRIGPRQLSRHVRTRVLHDRERMLQEGQSIGGAIAAAGHQQRLADGDFAGPRCGLGAVPALQHRARRGRHHIVERSAGGQRLGRLDGCRPDLQQLVGAVQLTARGQPHVPGDRDDRLDRRLGLRRDRAGQLPGGVYGRDRRRRNAPCQCNRRHRRTRVRRVRVGGRP